MRTIISLILLTIFSHRLSAQLERPNILFVLSDDHSVPFLECYGNPDLRTPNIDGLAEKGIRFTRAYTTAPQCVPSRASLMSGRDVVDIRMTRFSAPFPREVITFPEMLRTSGYYTGICGRSYHLDGSGRRPTATDIVFEEYSLETFSDRVDYLAKGGDAEVVDQLRTFLDEVPEGRPFFMWANFSDPHRVFDARDFEPDPASLALPPGFPDTEKVRADLAGHYGEIMRLDFHVGQLVAELEKRGLRDRTLIIFMGDNGAALFRGKGTLFETGLNVPLIASWPGKIPQGRSSSMLISGKDLAPTLLEVAGLQPDAKMTGLSLYPALVGQYGPSHTYVYASRGAHGSGLPNGTGAFDLGRTIIGNRYKLIYRALWQLPYQPVDFNGSEMFRELRSMHEDGTLPDPYPELFFAQSRPMFALYDLEEDPHEFRNLAGEPAYAAVEYELKVALQKWMILNQDYLPLPIPPGR